LCEGKLNIKIKRYPFGGTPKSLKGIELKRCQREKDSIKVEKSEKKTRKNPAWTLLPDGKCAEYWRSIC
jgi:hypothetical protein